MTENKRVIALGFFDGVHRGHQALLKKTVEIASERRAAASVISFDVHPDRVVFGSDIRLLNTVSGRHELIRQTSGINDIITIHFDRRLMETPWNEFLTMLKKELGAVHLVLGRDFCCGWRGLGNSERICAWGAENSVGVDVIDDVVFNGVTVRSTYIRELIAAGEIEKANAFLGHAHMLLDTVGSGYKIGRKIGAPTINTRIPKDVLVPKFGVYATKVWLADGAHPAVTNIGVRPTFGLDDNITVESNILNFSGDLYGQQVRLEFFSYLREEKKFDSAEELAAQIQLDIRQTEGVFA